MNINASVSFGSSASIWPGRQPDSPTATATGSLAISPGVNVSADYQRGVETSSPSYGVNYGGLLTKGVPLADQDRATLRQVADAWKTRQRKKDANETVGSLTLIELLLRTIPEQLRPSINEPEKILKAILASPEGQVLGTLLQDSIGALSTVSSVQDALLSALLLDVGYAAKPKRNSLAGYALRQQANWGYGAAEIAQRFETHLVKSVGAVSAPVAALLLLSVSAPEFRVKGLPLTLVYGSHSWATFSAAVERLDARQPGSTAVLSYEEIMARDEIAPTCAGEKRQRQLADMVAVIDWGVANGIIVERNDDEYPFEDAERALAALQAQHKILVDSITALSAPMPTRRELALAELTRVYGVENERFFEQRLLSNVVPGSPGRTAHSLLNIYMSGELGKHFWISSDPDFNTVKVNIGFPALKSIKEQFSEKFEGYSEGLKDAFNAQFKYQLSLLPAEDRRRIEHGKVTTFKLGVPNLHQGPVSPDHEIYQYVNSGAVLIRADLNGSVCHYLYAPARGQIIKDADPSRPGLQFPGSRLYFSMTRPGAQGGKEPAVTILWQPLRAPWPKKDPVDFAAVSIYPSNSLQAGVPESHPARPTETFTSPKSDELAAAVAAYYTRGMDEMKVAANGETEQEREKRTLDSVHQFFLSLIPFYSAVKSFSENRPTEGFFNAVLDVFGFLVPGLKGGIQAARLGFTGGVGSSLNFLKGFGSAGVQAINPLAGVYSVGRGVFKLGKAGFNKLRPLSGRYGVFQPPRLGGKDTIAEGIYRPLSSNAEVAPVLAIEQNGKWYAFDSGTQIPYGAPLKGFTPTASHPLIGQTVGTAINVVTEVGLSTTLILTEKALLRHYALANAPVNVAGFDSGKVHLSDVPPVPEFVDPHLLSRLDNASQSITELDRLILEFGKREGPSVKIESAEPREYIEHLELALDDVEDHTVEIATAYEVFCKPYNPREHIGQDYTVWVKRVEAIERRIDVLHKAFARVQALRVQ